MLGVGKLRCCATQVAARSGTGRNWCRQEAGAQRTEFRLTVLFICMSVSCKFESRRASVHGNCLLFLNLNFMLLNYSGESHKISVHSVGSVRYEKVNVIFSEHKLKRDVLYSNINFNCVEPQSMIQFSSFKELYIKTNTDKSSMHNLCVCQNIVFMVHLLYEYRTYVTNDTLDDAQISYVF